MSWLVGACGAVLAILGAISVFSGAPYIRMEFGWTEVIAGATAFSGGLVTMALGAVLHRLKALQDALSGRFAAEPPRGAATRRLPDGLPAAGDPAAVAPSPTEAAPAPRPSSEPQSGPESPAAAMPPTPRPSLLARLGPRREGTRAVAAPVAEVQPAPAPSPPLAPEDPVEPASPFHRVGVEDVAEAGGVAEREVVGRYEAGGASYALFSDGTIEVTTANGTRRFGSMEELRAYVESQDADKPVIER